MCIKKSFLSVPIFHRVIDAKKNRSKTAMTAIYNFDARCQARAPGALRQQKEATTMGRTLKDSFRSEYLLTEKK